MGTKKRTTTKQKNTKRKTALKEKALKPFPIVIVGFGRLGGALALSLKKARWPVSVFPRSNVSVRKAATLGVKLADHDDLHEAGMCIFAVPDATIHDVAQAMAEDLGAQTTLVHLSGAMHLDVFGFPKRKLGSFHPLVAVSDSTDSLAHYSAALASNHQSVNVQLHQLAHVLQMKPLHVPETGRASYHAGAVLCAGLTVALLDAGAAAFERAGLKREEAMGALLPLMQSALNAVAQRGIDRSLTGPVVRGDVGTVQAHLLALSPDLGSIYRLLSQRALLLTSTLPHETQLALSRLLM
jgi:predicted short-subunit dehydrogenase-like oxidoreductase (DUF2520 family)